MQVIAHIRSDFPTKFGLPRQSGLSDGLKAAVVFEPSYRRLEAVRGLESFSHLWLIWQFSEVKRAEWSSTVRPPRLGGNRRVGVFATRSPFRPNAIGLSSVRLERIGRDEPDAPVLYITGADLMDGTPILDVKPYLPYTDAHPDAADGLGTPFAHPLRVECPDTLLQKIPPEKREGLLAALAEDPRPAYQSDEARVYGMPYAGQDIRFRVAKGVLTVCEIVPWEKDDPVPF